MAFFALLTLRHEPALRRARALRVASLVALLGTLPSPSAWGAPAADGTSPLIETTAPADTPPAPPVRVMQLPLHIDGGVRIAFTP